jgi:hypothetical protein
MLSAFSGPRILSTGERKARLELLTEGIKEKFVIKDLNEDAEAGTRMLEVNFDFPLTLFPLQSPLSLFQLICQYPPLASRGKISRQLMKRDLARSFIVC